MPPDPAWLVSAAGFALAMTASPGPNNALVAASGANFGLRRTWPHMLGVAFGFPVMLVLVALGAAAPLHASPLLQAGLRWVGALWLLWLAWRLATAPVAPAPEATPGAGATPAAAPGKTMSLGGGPARPMTFLQAALFQWVNPKAWMIAAGAIAAYTGAEVLADSLALALIFVPAALLSVLGWTALGAGTARHLLRRPAALRRFNQAMGALLALSVLPLLLG